MSETMTGGRWVAFGPAGAVGSIHRLAEDRYEVRLIGEEQPRGSYPSLEVAKNALHASQLPGSERPEFREH